MDLGGHWAYLENIAERRLKKNKTSRHVYRYGTEIELLGAAGELAARRFLGLDTKLHIPFDGGMDLSWRGYRVDVKTTRLTPKLNYRYLQWPKGKPIHTDIVLLIAVDMWKKEATAVGWVWSEMVRGAPINPDRDFPCHEIPVPELRPMWELYILPDKRKKAA